MWLWTKKRKRIPTESTTALIARCLVVDDDSITCIMLFRVVFRLRKALNLLDRAYSKMKHDKVWKRDWEDLMSGKDQ